MAKRLNLKRHKPMLRRWRLRGQTCDKTDIPPADYNATLEVFMSRHGARTHLSPRHR